jgi:hypothetical protein
MAVVCRGASTGRAIVEASRRDATTFVGRSHFFRRDSFSSRAPRCSLAANSDLPRQCAVNGTPVGDLQQPRALLGGQVAGQIHFFLDQIHVCGRLLAVRAIVNMDLLVTEADDDTRERPSFPPRVHVHGHRGTSAERCQQQLVRVGAGVRPADRDRFIGGMCVCEPESSARNRYPPR